MFLMWLDTNADYFDFSLCQDRGSSRWQMGVTTRGHLWMVRLMAREYATSHRTAVNIPASLFVGSFTAAGR